MKNAAAPGTIDADGFRKSSYSVRNPVIRFCVSAKVDGDSVLVRDTKNPAAIQRYSRDEWNAFLQGVKAGEFDL